MLKHLERFTSAPILPPAAAVLRRACCWPYTAVLNEVNTFWGYLVNYSVRLHVTSLLRPARPRESACSLRRASCLAWSGPLPGPGAPSEGCSYGRWALPVCLAALFPYSLLSAYLRGWRHFLLMVALFRVLLVLGVGALQGAALLRSLSDHLWVISCPPSESRVLRQDNEKWMMEPAGWLHATHRRSPRLVISAR